MKRSIRRLGAFQRYKGGVSCSTTSMSSIFTKSPLWSIAPLRQYRNLLRLQREKVKAEIEEISPTVTDTARKKKSVFICVGLAALHTLTFFRGSKSILRRSTPMCNENKDTARKEESHAEVTDSQRRNAPL